jgi:hypothetical protein
LLLVRIFDKQMRIATDADALGESPFADISGYGILGAHMHQTKKESSPCKSATSISAGAEDARTPSVPGHNDSAHPTVEAPSSPKGNVAIELPTTLRPNDIAASATSAPAPNATGVASPSVGDPVEGRIRLTHTFERWNYRFNTLQCIACEGHLPADRFRIDIRSSLGCIAMYTCTRGCREFCFAKLRANQVEGAR